MKVINRLHVAPELVRAGAAEADITPAKGIQLAGDIGRLRPVEEVRDPLYAKALVVEAGGRKVCWLSLDVLAITQRWADEIRRQAAARFDLDAEAVMVHVVQNHAAPSIGHFFVMERDEFGVFPPEYPWLLGGDDRYSPFAVEQTLHAIEKALAVLQGVQVSAGRGVDGRVAFNRRFIMRDGTGRTHPGSCNPNVLYCEGPMDPEVGVMTFKAESGRIVAALLHHTCHPVHGYPQRFVTAGWPGAWCDGARSLLGPGCVPLVINGFCGNIHHCNHLDPTYKDDYQEMGRKLTETTARILPALQPMERPRLDVRTRWLKIPMRKPAEAEVAEARRMLKEYPRPKWKDAAHTAADWDWVFAAMRLDLAGHYDRNPLCDYYVQVFRLGAAGLVAVPGEPFVEEQLRIKLKSPAAFTFMAHMSNGFGGYIPTEQAFQHGGYETRTGTTSKLAPEALRMVGDTALALLKELF